jgi:transcription antitermination factor NusG
MVMQKNWYVLYTKPQCEKKVAALMTKKKIENFVPQVCIEAQKSWRNKIINRPLFKSYVFVQATEQEVGLLSNAEGVINLLYWLGKPAVINETEINAMREFTNDYENIGLEKLSVNSNTLEKNIFHSSYQIEGNVVAVKNKTIKVNLPSLGYAMVANLKENNIFGRDRSMLPNYTFAQS